MRPEVQTSLDSDLVFIVYSGFRYLNTCSLTLVRVNGSDRLDRFLCPTSNPGRSRCLLVPPSNCIKGVVGGRIFEGRRSIGEVDEVELLERLSGAESSGRPERSGAERSGAARSGSERDGARLWRMRRD